jgi:histone H2B
MHPDKGISQRGMSVTNSFVNDIYKKLVLKARKLARNNKEVTLSP